MTRKPSRLHEATDAQIRDAARRKLNRDGMTNYRVFDGAWIRRQRDPKGNIESAEVLTYPQLPGGFRVYDKDLEG